MSSSLLHMVLNSVFILLLLPCPAFPTFLPLLLHPFQSPLCGNITGRGPPVTKETGYTSVTSAKTGSFFSPSSVFLHSSFSFLFFTSGRGDTQKWGRYIKWCIWISVSLLFTNCTVHKKEQRKKEKQGFIFKIDSYQGPAMEHEGSARW